MHGKGNQAHPFQQSGNAPPRPLMQQTSNLTGPPLYQRVPPPPPPRVQYGGGVPIQGSAPLVHSYPPGQISSQYPQHLGSQSVYHVTLPRPPPPRVLPPPPPLPYQGQAMYVNHVQPPPSSGSVQGCQNVPQPLSLPPPPLNSSLQSPAHSLSMMSPPPPPPPAPLPSSPPPLPPCPPLPAAPLPESRRPPSTQLLSASELSSNPGPSKIFGSTEMASDLVNEVAGHNPQNDDSVHDSCISGQDGLRPHVGPLVKDVSSTKDNAILDLHQPPPSLKDEKFDRNVDYQPSDSSSRHTEFEASMQPNSLMDAGTSHSPANSDMDMEDDITQFGEEPEINNSFKALNPESSVMNEEVDVKRRLHALPSALVSSLLNDNLSKNVLGSSGRTEKAGSSKHPLDINEEKPSISAGAADVVSGKLYGQQTVGDNQFRLLRDYASFDGAEIDGEPLNHNSYAVKPSLSVAADPKSSDADGGPIILAGALNTPNRKQDSGSLSPRLEPSLSMLTGCQKFSFESEVDFKETILTSTVIEKAGGYNDNKVGSQMLVQHPKIKEAIKTEDALEGDGVDNVAESVKSQKYESKYASTLSKIDEFGRLVRDGVSDSDSDDNRYSKRRGRRGRSRSRSRSRSISPHDRVRRRRRSPWRKEKRSRSRSRSPKRRSRSRSPGYKRARGLGGEIRRKDKGQVSVCFDFLRGRCYRGASCRYTHHDSDRSDGSRCYKSKQHSLEISQSSKGSENHSDTKTILEKVSSRGRDEVKSQESELLVTDVGESEVSRMAGDRMQDSKEVLEELEGQVKDLSGEDTCKKSMETHQPLLVGSLPSQSVAQELASGTFVSTVSSVTDSATPHLQTPVAVHKMDDSSRSDSSRDQTSTFSSSTQLPASEPYSNNISSAKSFPVTNPTSQSFSSENLLLQHPPLSNQLSVSQGMGPLHIPQAPRDYNMMQPTVSMPHQFPPGNSIPSYSAPLPNQHTYPVAPPSSMWASLPPPPPPLRPYIIGPNVYASTANPGFSSSFQQNHLPSGNDFTNHTFKRSYPSDMHSHGNSQNQSFGGPNLVKDDSLHVQGVTPSNSYLRGNMQTQTMPSSINSPATKPHGIGLPTADNVSDYLGLPGKISSMSRFPSDNLDANQLSGLHNFGGSKVSAHYNPYASTFDQPLTSKFSSTTFRQEAIPYSSKSDAPFAMGHLAADGQGGQGLGSRPTSHSPNPLKAIVGQSLPRSGGDQYDPLFDSIEQSPNSFVKSDHDRKRDSTNESNFMLRLSASHKPLDLEENNKRKEVGAVAGMTSLENDEFGETAEAEAGAVEDESLSNPTDFPNTDAGEIEIDQKSPGKRKKGKDSRSMKLFKSAIADFVKEVLKPSWRQGNMSKEAFKTIVKKTVDKVSGAMKGHHVPKSQVKINQYIDSSQRKLTKLVMGYVDKYVKM